MRSRSRIRVPTKKTRSWGINVAVNPVETCRSCTWSTWGGRAEAPEFAAKRKPRPPCATLRPGSFLRGYRTAITQSDAAYQQTPWSPTLFRQSRCQGVCGRGWWCPFYGRFPQKNRCRGRPRPRPYPCRAGARFQRTPRLESLVDSGGTELSVMLKRCLRGT